MAAVFVFCSTKYALKIHSPGQLVFGGDIILPMKHTVDWELLRQQKKKNVIEIPGAKIIEELTMTKKVGDKFIVTNHFVLTYEMTYDSPFELMQFCSNVTVVIQYGAIKLVKIHVVLSQINLAQTLNILNVEEHV